MHTTLPSLWNDRPDDWDDAAPETPPPPPPPPRYEPPSPRRPRPLAVALVVAALAATGGGAYAIGSGGDSQPATAEVIAPTPKTDVGRVYAKVAAGVVSVRVGNGSGTGFVIDTKGTIVTNDHVVGNATTAKVRFGDDDTLIDARVVGTDPSSDLAVLRVNPGDAAALKPLSFAPSSKVAVGDTAIAIGYPLGLDRTATAGIISGLGREIQAPNGYRIDNVLQTDAPINPGNSGGPLLDAQGRVIGINSQIATAGGGSGNVGIGFAVPSDTVQEIVPKILTGETIKRPWLGISTEETTSGTGARIGKVTAGSPAASAGMQAGDVITAIDGTTITGPDAVANAIANQRPGDTVNVKLIRGGREQTLKLTLGTRPDTAP
jgi:putative serine protease PepD